MTRLAIDFGARFTDALAWDDTGARIVKLPSGELAEVLAKALEQLALDAARLEDVRIVTTAPLNALLARRPARTALITTRGFGDTLQLGRQNRVALYDPVAQSPAPRFLVEDTAIHEVGGRLDAEGAEIEPLDQEGLAAAVAAIRAAGAEAVAVCLLFAHVNSTHEEEVAQALAAGLPGVTVSLSHRVDPAPREYERTVSTLLDAWLSATAAAEMRALSTELVARGFSGPLLYGDGQGVLVPAATAEAERAKVLAGAPAAAARAAAALSDAVTLAIDIGSQSADISLSRGGEVISEPLGSLAGVPLRMTTADMASVALGGSRAVRAEGGRLRFDGAEGAATLDDALCLLGRLQEGKPDRLATIAAAIGRTSEEAAQRIVASAEAEMAAELTRFATRRNVDPTRARLVVMGGTGALLAAGVAEAMGLNRVTLPAAPAAAGAMGLALSTRRAEARVAVDTPLADLTTTALEKLLTDLDARLADAPGRTVWSLALAARRPMHHFPLRFHDRPASGEEILTAFAEAYAAAYGIAPPGPGHLFHVIAWRDAPRAPFPGVPSATTPGPGAVATAAGVVWVPEGWRLLPVDGGFVLERIAS